MGQEIVRQLNFNVGEIDPHAASREDIKVYFAGLEYAENLVPLPVGPLIRRPGLTFIDYVRHTLATVELTAAMLTAPEGGAVANAITADGTLFETTADLGAADQVVLAIDFGQAVDVSLIDLIDYAVKDVGAPADPDPAPFTYSWPGLSGPIDIGVGGAFGPQVFP